MIFVRTDQLKEGMRLARPIYNKTGVLLYERNSKLTRQGMDSIRNFGLIGLFILEPAEPVPPMTAADLEFERFQTMTVFALQEELNFMYHNLKQQKLQTIIGNITKFYGHLDKKINFIQSLRSREDCTYKHAMNTAILCAMMSHLLNLKVEDRLNTVTAALVHVVGSVVAAGSAEYVNGEEWLSDEQTRLLEKHGMEIIDHVFISQTGIRRICAQFLRAEQDFDERKTYDDKTVIGAKILLVAETFDHMTAMHYGRVPASEVAALKYLMEYPEAFPKPVVDALIQSINILGPGTSVELSSGAKGLVLVENQENILRPTVLDFRDNSIIDLGNDRVYGDLEIQDIMKTMDNRYIIDIDTLRKYGFHTEEHEFV